jgi:hypothetical protein
VGKWGKRLLDLLEELVEGGGALYFVAKTYTCWDLTFATERNSSIRVFSAGNRGSDNVWNSDLTERQN